MHTIYLITNTITGKKYVGYTSTTIEQRVSAHRSAAKTGSMYLIHQSIRKHGWEVFKVEELYSSEDGDYTLKVMEPQFIKEHGSYGGGYNMTAGGEGSSGPCSEEKATNISEAKKGMKVPWLIGHKHNNGFFWINDGVTSKRCYDILLIPEGWVKGRINKVGPRLHGTKRPKFPNGYKTKIQNISK